MIRKHEMVRIMASGMLSKGKTRDEIVNALETEYGEDVTVLRKRDHDELCFVPDDSSPTIHILNFPAVKG